MSDMLQLVVEITYPQSGYDPLRRTSSVAHHDDKLKHIGHGLSLFDAVTQPFGSVTG